jgi:hypothetical protein
MTSMSHSTEDSRDDVEIVLGVDTHKDTHVASVITILGRLVAPAAFPTTKAGYRDLLAWARSFGVVYRAGGGRHRFLRRGAGPLPAPA